MRRATATATIAIPAMIRKFFNGVLSLCSPSILDPLPRLAGCAFEVTVGKVGKLDQRTFQSQDQRRPRSKDHCKRSSETYDPSGSLGSSSGSNPISSSFSIARGSTCAKVTTSES